MVVPWSTPSARNRRPGCLMFLVVRGLMFLPCVARAGRNFWDRTVAMNMNKKYNVQPRSKSIPGLYGGGAD